MKTSEKVAIYLEERKEEVLKSQATKTIAKIAAVFNITKPTAQKHYYKWKKQCMGIENCVPTKELEKGPVIKNKDYKINGITDNNGLRIEGKRGKYIKYKTGVRAGDLFFKNEKELDFYMRKEIEEFKLRLGEILEVMELEVTYE